MYLPVSGQQLKTTSLLHVRDRRYKLGVAGKEGRKERVITREIGAEQEVGGRGKRERECAGCVTIPEETVGELESRRRVMRVPPLEAANWTVVSDGEERSRHQRVTVDLKACDKCRDRGWRTTPTQ